MLYLPGRCAFVHAFAIPVIMALQTGFFLIMWEGWNWSVEKGISAGWDYGIKEKPGITLQYLSYSYLWRSMMREWSMWLTGGLITVEAEIFRSHMLIVSEESWLERKLLVGYCEGWGVSLILFSIFSCNEQPSTKWLLTKFVDNKAWRNSKFCFRKYSNEKYSSLES